MCHTNRSCGRRMSSIHTYIYTYIHTYIHTYLPLTELRARVSMPSCTYTFFIWAKSKDDYRNLDVFPSHLITILTPHPPIFTHNHSYSNHILTHKHIQSSTHTYMYSYPLIPHTRTPTNFTLPVTYLATLQSWPRADQCSGIGLSQRSWSHRPELVPALLPELPRSEEQ